MLYYSCYQTFNNLSVISVINSKKYPLQNSRYWKLFRRNFWVFYRSPNSLGNYDWQWSDLSISRDNWSLNLTAHSWFPGKFKLKRLLFPGKTRLKSLNFTGPILPRYRNIWRHSPELLLLLLLIIILLLLLLLSIYFMLTRRKNFTIKIFT